MNNTPFTRRVGAPVRLARMGGFTLIEMMISVTIGLGILAGLVGVLATNASNSRTNDRTSELLTNGRYALNAMKQELREAGFRGYTLPEPATPLAMGALTNECLEAGGAAGQFITNLRQPVWGSNDANPFAATCIPAASYSAGNDVLVVRRLGVLPATALVANTIYFASTYDRGQVFRGATAPTFTGAPLPLANFPLQTYVYYISPFTVAATEVPLVPALYRVTLDNTGAMVRELVASGIERMQVQYGRLSTVPDTQYTNTLTGASWSADAALRTDWEDVNAVRIWLLARNATPEPGYVNTNTYAMGSAADFTPNDGFRRQLFTTVVQLRN